jgi:Family of unknown function (DUF6006)
MVSVPKLLFIVFVSFFVPEMVRATPVAAPNRWYLGAWSDCRLDGRPARMQWRVVPAPPPLCRGNVCNKTAGLRILGRFSDNDSAWVPLAIRFARGNELGIRYLGAEQDNWSLLYNPGTKVAKGFVNWRGKSYPIECRR